MDTSAPKPMVNSTLLRRFVGKRVRAVVKVLGNENGVYQCEAADGGQVTVKPGSRGTYGTPFVEVIGLVESDQVIQEEDFTNFGDNFNMANYNQLCIMSNGDYQALFL